jgi:hypothetical protein
MMMKRHRGVTITGTKEAVFRAEEMIMRLCLCYSSAGSVGSGGGGGEGSSDASSAAAAAAAVPSAEADGEDGVASYGDADGGIAGDEASSHYRVGRFEAGGAPRTFYVHPPTPQRLQLQHQRQYLPHFAPPPLPVIEIDIISCERSDIGYIIGRRGVTINDLQRRSSCDIQIDQATCKIHVKGQRSGIELTRRMLEEIVERGPDHMFAGGTRFDGTRQRRGPPSPPDAASGRQYPSYLQPMYPHDAYGLMVHPQPVLYQQEQQQQHPYPQSHAEQMCRQQWPRDQYPALQASPWMAATTPDGMLYYYNVKTQETRWVGQDGMTER